MEEVLKIIQNQIMKYSIHNLETNNLYGKQNKIFFKTRYQPYLALKKNLTQLLYWSKSFLKLIYPDLEMDLLLV